MDIVVLNNIINEINRANKIAILVHINPDGDAIGSGLTMYIVLKQLKKDVDLIIPEYPHIYESLPHTSDIITDTSVRQYDLCICLDCASRERIFEPRNIFSSSKVKVVIDHHSSNTLFGDYNLIMSEEPACSQVLINIIDRLNVRLTKKMGECLIAGIITDTDGFRNSNINANTFDIASRLMKLDIDVSKVYRELLETKTRAQFELIKLINNRLELYEDNRIAFAYLKKEDMNSVGALKGDHEGLVDIGKSLSGVIVSIFLREEDNCYNVSFRSNDNFNVRDIAKSFGGGGHTVAAGCIIPGDLDEVRTKVLTKVKKSLDE